MLAHELRYLYSMLTQQLRYRNYVILLLDVKTTTALFTTLC